MLYRKGSLFICYLGLSVLIPIYHWEAVGTHFQAQKEVGIEFRAQKWAYAR